MKLVWLRSLGLSNDWRTCGVLGWASLLRTSSQATRVAGSAAMPALASSPDLVQSLVHLKADLNISGQWSKERNRNG
jgi:hypothetical protein